MAKVSNRRAWIRTRLTNLIAQEFNKPGVDGWLMIYHAVLGPMSTDQIAGVLREVNRRRRNEIRRDSPKR